MDDLTRQFIGAFVRYTVIPLALGFGAYAAVLLAGPGGDDLSLTRLLVGFLAWVSVAAATVYVTHRMDGR
ncbi:hypothetical protein [Streptomyces sp. PvR018]|uniref:hypothetical protein n=1 Tax=Streptomyces sp. PvR018 TaxID=3156442 RepID=UPI003395F12D